MGTTTCYKNIPISTAIQITKFAAILRAPSITFDVNRLRNRIAVTIDTERRSATYLQVSKFSLFFFFAQLKIVGKRREQL